MVIFPAAGFVARADVEDRERAAPALGTSNRLSGQWLLSIFHIAPRRAPVS
ncbi:hypothetical protein [Frankia sp. EAN1pec]|uniref:hypothetical protein n=1 Tax=Parafrankia sp. (strain EAN1pec) TaxID=298653 RepID=UPI0012F866B6